jgi:hypothetical protein
MQSQAIWMQRHSRKLHGGFPWLDSTANCLHCSVMQRFVAAPRLRERTGETMTINNRRADGSPFNILIIITDQERAVAEWPEGYRRKLEHDLPAMRRLKETGLSFDHAYTAACMCSPSRATLQTSNYPIVTNCTTTGTAVLPSPTDYANIASVMSAAGYTSYWIGKWHLLGKNEPGSGSGDSLRGVIKATIPPRITMAAPMPGILPMADGR